MSIVTALFFFKKWKNHELLIILQGVILFGWIFFQVIFLQQFNWMHATFGTVAVFLIWWGYSLHRISRKLPAGVE